MKPAFYYKNKSYSKKTLKCFQGFIRNLKGGKSFGNYNQFNFPKQTVRRIQTTEDEENLRTNQSKNEEAHQ